MEASLSTRISEGTKPDLRGAAGLALRYALFAVAAALLAAPLIVLEQPWASGLLLWLAIANGVVAYAYATGRVAVFGKRGDGKLALWNTLLLLPYLLLVWAFFWAKTLGLRPEPCWHEAAPGLYVGRKPRAFELPRDCTLVLDLTCEFTEASDVVGKQAYRCVPILNRHVIAEADMRALLQSLVAHEGGLYVHCGAGRGRSAMVTAALLVLRGYAADVQSAEAALARLRPGVKLHAVQRALIARCCSTLRSGAALQSRPASAATTSAS